MKQKFIQYITEHDLFAPGEHLVVGVSGGADSVCLLKLLHEIRSEWRLTLSVVHINHGIRSREAKGDACYVRELAERWELPFYLIERDVPALAREHGQSEEEAGRELRYRELETIRAPRKRHEGTGGHGAENRICAAPVTGHDKGGNRSIFAA